MSGDDHLSLEELAELDEGLLPAERTSAIRAHLHGCATCRARAEALTSTRASLAGLPAARMPDDVARHIDATLAAAPTPPAAEAERGPDAAPAVSRSAEVVPVGSVRRPRFGRPTMAASAAAAAVVLVVAAVLVGHYLTHGNGSAGSATPAAAGRANGSAANGVVAPRASGSFTQSSTGRTYTTANLASGVQSLVARVSDTVATPSTAGSPGTGAQGAAGAGGGVAGKHQSSLDHKASRNSGLTLAPAAPTVPQRPVPKPLRALAGSKASILACAARLTGVPGAVPITVDFGRWNNPPTYRHAPSAIFVFQAANASKLAVYVTSPACDGTFEEFANVPLPS